MARWNEDLLEWLQPFLAQLGHKRRRQMCPAYVAGLIGPGDRETVQPKAARDSDVSYDRLHHFIGSGVWMHLRSKQRCSLKPTSWLAATMPG